MTKSSAYNWLDCLKSEHELNLTPGDEREMVAARLFTKRLNSRGESTRPYVSKAFRMSTNAQKVCVFLCADEETDEVVNHGVSAPPHCPSVRRSEMCGAMRVWMRALKNLEGARCQRDRAVLVWTHRVSMLGRRHRVPV